MVEHEIDQATLALESPDAPTAREDIVHHTASTSGKRIAWHESLAMGVAHRYHAHMYWHRRKRWDFDKHHVAVTTEIRFFGRLSAVQAASYTLSYLIREVSRLCDREAPSETYSRTYRNAWRLGCARRIYMRLHDENPDAGIPHASEGVLMRIQSDRAEVDNAYEAFAKTFSKGNHNIGRRTGSYAGYRAGLEAGENMRIDSARGGLRKGQESLS